MLKEFWEEQKILIGFTGFTATTGALFLNISTPDNQQVKTALANIQVFWLLLLIVGLTFLFVRFIKLIFKAEKVIEDKHPLFVRGPYSITASLLFLWIISNFLAYILALYSGPFTVVLFMTSGALIITLASGLEYLVHKYIKKFSLFSEFMVESFGMAGVLTYALIILDVFTYQSRYIQWSGLTFVTIFAIIFLSSLGASVKRGREIFTSRAFQNMKIRRKRRAFYL